MINLEIPFDYKTQKYLTHESITLPNNWIRYSTCIRMSYKYARHFKSLIEISSCSRRLRTPRQKYNKESCEWRLRERKKKWHFCFVRLFGNGVSERRQGDRRTPASSPASVAAVRSTPSSTSQQQQQSQQSQQSQPNPANPPTSPSSQPLSLQELTVRTITMTRDPPDSHGFGICVKGGKDAGEIRSTFRLPPSPYFAPQDRGIFRKLWLSLPFVARRSLFAAVVLDSHRIAIRRDAARLL